MAWDPSSDVNDQLRRQRQWQPNGPGRGGFAQQALADSSASAFMAAVYRWMFVGLALTAGVSWYTAHDQGLFTLVMRNFFLFSIAELAAVFALAIAAPRMSGAVATVVFLGYAVLSGLTLSGIFYAYRLGSIFNVFLVSSAAFGAMALYGTVTKKDLSAWFQFLFIGLIGMIIASVVNIFTRSDAVGWITSCVGVVVFGGFTAYDNQKLRQYHASAGYSSSQALAINGALILYLDFINLFLSMLRLFGRRR